MTAAAAKENPYAGQGPVLLDIGGDVGALVVTVPARLDGVEVEIRPVGDDAETGEPSVDQQWTDRHGSDDHGAGRHEHAGSGHRHHPHVAVVGRPTAGGIVHSLVYPEVREGRYRLHRLPGGAAALEVDVVGGRVTDAVWPTAG
jgi:hypothetical protein